MAKRKDASITKRGIATTSIRWTTKQNVKRIEVELIDSIDNVRINRGELETGIVNIGSHGW